MRIILTLDQEGIVKAEIVADQAEQEEAHNFWQAIQAAIQELDVAVRNTAGAEMRSEEKARAHGLATGELSKKPSARQRKKRCNTISVSQSVKHARALS